MKSRKNKVSYNDPGKTNYAVLFLLVASVLAVAITYRLTEKGYLSADTFGPSKLPPIVSNGCEVSKVTSLVIDAADLLKRNGENAFLEFKKEGGAWRTGNSYVFVYDMSGKTLVLPPQPELEGTNRLNVKDSNGVYFVREMVNQLKNNESGWLQYSYPKPGERTPSEKLSYFQKVKVGAKTYIVGTGMYF